MNNLHDRTPHKTIQHVGSKIHRTKSMADHPQDKVHPCKPNAPRGTTLTPQGPTQHHSPETQMYTSS